ncbi:MAG: flagellar hook-basal body protein [bacterium]|jgi:flagellar basal-body rod protein FlgG|nr:flagellar hook-basal body protein [bacterium]
MIKGLWDSGAGMIARGIQQDITGTNLANARTTAFKEDRLNFREMIDGRLLLDRGRGVPSPENRLRQGFETRLRAGEFQQTGAPLDFALDGPGYFVVETADGERYTRDGHFLLSPEGVLVTADGLPVLGEGGLIRLGPGPVESTGDGRLAQNGTVVGALRVVEFDEPARLAKLGRNLWQPRPEDTQPAPATATRPVQGMLEGSNIQVVEQMVKLIEQERTYAFAHKALQIQDENLGKAVGDLGRLR